MTQDQIVTIFQDGLTVLLWVSLPVLLVGLVVGLVISVIQATTQVNEQTLVIVAKIVATLLALVFFGPSMLNSLLELFTRVYEYAALIR